MTVQVVVSVARDGTEFVEVREMYAAGYHQRTNVVYWGIS